MTKNVAIKQRFADLTDGAAFSGYSKRQLYQLIRDGALRAYQPAGKLLIDLDELTALIKNNPYDPKTRIDRIVDEVMGEVAG